MTRYLCIHGHFYQPPRENPWLETIELQDSAYPYHDWNERITAECYAPNANARTLDGEGQITRISNNYSRISFNFGPTLLSWAQAKAPELYRDILNADRESMEHFGGHGSAVAQAYGHTILPLSNRRDKETQIRWGKRDFQQRFGRDPEGMWLPETAVDLESLDLMAQHGIQFTILAPSQAARFRPIGGSGGDWQDVTGARIDPSRVYRCALPSGRSIDLFFYDGPVSRAVAFERLLDSGERFAHRLASSFAGHREGGQLAHIATDGETYGHHHRFGEMALSYALQHIEDAGIAKLTNYGQFRALFPAQNEVQILENTAWSCAHGVGRWSTDCGCNAGGGYGQWRQTWRAPLRAALDWLRDAVAEPYERALGRLLTDPWEARNAYIDVVLDRSPDVRARFLNTFAKRPLQPAEEVQCWRLLELQRHAMLMYTSCGWFFDEISGLETVQVLEYAGRVVQLATDALGLNGEPEFLRRLAEAPSNVPELGHGARVYETMVKPAIVTLEKVGAHYAIASLFRRYQEENRVYSYTVAREEHRVQVAGGMRLAAGRARFTSEITQEQQVLTFAVLHFGDHNLIGGVRPYRGEEALADLIASLNSAFDQADMPASIRLLDRAFNEQTYNLQSLFRDERHYILDEILDFTLNEAETAYRQIYNRQAPLLRFLAESNTPLPPVLQSTAQYALNARLRRKFAADPLEPEKIRTALEEADSLRVALDATTLEFTLRRSIERLTGLVESSPLDVARLVELQQALDLLPEVPFPVTLWIPQNVCYRLLQDHLPAQLQRAGQGDADARAWVDALDRMAQSLMVRLEVPVLA